MHEAGAWGHAPVLRDEVLDLLAVGAYTSPLVLDGTFGRGGHTEALLQAAERERAAAESEARALEAAVSAAARRAESQRLALARAEARRYGLAADLMTCARTTEELRERAAAARGEATA